MEYFFFGDNAPIEKKGQSVNNDIPEQTTPANQLNTHPD
jgi:hypothetical protein